MTIYLIYANLKNDQLIVKMVLLAFNNSKVFFFIKCFINCVFISQQCHNDETINLNFSNIKICTYNKY